MPRDKNEDQDWSRPSLWWPTLEEDQYQLELEILGDWVDELCVRYSHLKSDGVLKPCWSQHRGQVEILSALKDAEELLYGGGAALTGAATWQELLARLEMRLANLSRNSGCTVRTHSEGKSENIKKN